MFKLIKIQLEIFAGLQTLLPSLQIAIFWHIAPYDFPIPEKFVPCKRCFPLWKSPFSDASPPYDLPIAEFFV